LISAPVKEHGAKVEAENWDSQAFSEKIIQKYLRRHFSGSGLKPGFIYEKARLYVISAGI
jgi:hypothetical protein